MIGRDMFDSLQRTTAGVLGCRPPGDDSSDGLRQDRGVPVLACPECGLWQYAHVSYVTTVCCVACARDLDVRGDRLASAARRLGANRPPLVDATDVCGELALEVLPPVGWGSGMTATTVRPGGAAGPATA